MHLNNKWTFNLAQNRQLWAYLKNIVFIYNFQSIVQIFSKPLKCYWFHRIIFIILSYFENIGLCHLKFFYALHFLIYNILVFCFNSFIPFVNRGQIKKIRIWKWTCLVWWKYLIKNLILANIFDSQFTLFCGWCNR